MTDVVETAVAAASEDPAIGLRAVLALRRAADRLETQQVENARRHGWPWQDIADALEVSRQAVHKKHAGGRGPGVRGHGVRGHGVRGLRGRGRQDG